MALGLLSLGLIETVKGFGKIKDLKNRKDNKKNHKVNNYCYVHDDGLRLYSNGHKCMHQVCYMDNQYPNCKKGDRILVDLSDMSLVKNFGNPFDNIHNEFKEKTNKFLEDKFKGKSVYCIDDSCEENNSDLKGLRVIDRETGEKYVVNKYIGRAGEQSCLYLVNPITWLIVKEIEGYNPMGLNKDIYEKRKHITSEEMNNRILEYKNYKNTQLQYLSPCSISISKYLV